MQKGNQSRFPFCIYKEEFLYGGIVYVPDRLIHI